MSVLSEDISRKAYEIWEREGRPAGRDQEFWFLAEQEARSGVSSAQRDSGRQTSIQSSPMSKPASSSSSSDKSKSRRASKARG